jgi:hypothetical protein
VEPVIEVWVAPVPRIPAEKRKYQRKKAEANPKIVGFFKKQTQWRNSRQC